MLTGIGQGWDWGPALNTCGPWRPISLEVYEARIADLSFETAVDKGLAFADVDVTVEVEGSPDKIKIEISLAGEEVASKTVVVTGDSVKIPFHLKNPALWYPIRYGKQPLYDIKATILHNDTAVDTVTKKTGLRRARLIQRPLDSEPGTTFFFEINNIPIFCGGSDWIPADNFLPLVTPQKYHDWIALVAAGNQSMLRVWGGGIYEDAAFYSACDGAGILVWQDFMFGCGNYPTLPPLLTSIAAEAESNVRRLRHHPSIVIWAGNNEDYQFQESEHLTYDYANKDPASWLKTDFPARYIVRPLLLTSTPLTLTTPDSTKRSSPTPAPS